MPFPMKIQPIDVDSVDEFTRNGSVKPAGKSRFKRLFERQLPSVLRSSTAEKITGAPEAHLNKDVSVDLDPSSVCLAHMVQNFLEGNDKQSVTVRHGRNRCNCFNGSNNSSEDELDSCNCFRDSNFSSSGDACEVLKSLVPCASVSERNLLADTSKIVEKNKISKRKDDYCRKIVRDGLLALGYDASICKSRWEKSPSHPAGEYEYVDVITEGERLIIDIDFRSEFEIARSTKSFKAILQTLPVIFVGKADRLQRIVSLVSEAAERSLKKRGMPFPPWRKAEYVIAKWLAPYTRTNSEHNISQKSDIDTEGKESLVPVGSSSKLIFGEDLSPRRDGVFTLSDCSGEREKAMVKEWEPPEIKPKNSNVGLKIMTGLASVMDEKP
ncbi:uncharacterized protein LOC127786534 [Diospyros lotus]|uniref:uncharacterized protein LOC127786534 n=1 Tax=Diospyros lotus TaxID=55363 RepID=UPI00224EBFF3|nr:uncharacterized protein LOC127786534 [Diospyros lotus]